MRARHFAAVVASLAVAGVVGCGSSGRPMNPDLMVDVWTDKTALSDGDTVLIRVTVTNPYDFPLVEQFPDGCQFGYRIEWAGTIVARPPGGCTMEPTHLDIPANEVIVRDLTWTWNRDELAPGSYDLFAGLGRFGGPGPPVEILLRSDSPSPE